MSQAVELLNSLTHEEMSRISGSGYEEPYIMINDDRTISVPASLRKIAVQHDHAVETVKISCPRYWDGVDMSSWTASINYVRSDGYTDKYPVVFMLPSFDRLYLEWTITKNVTEVPGRLSFMVCLQHTDADTGLTLAHWNSEINQEMYVSEGMECEEHTVVDDPDLVAQVLQRLTNIERDIVITGASRIADVNLMSANWQGSNNLYSQIVSVDGVTENSKVDLNPSVEQLAVFYQKDLTFVTENEDGVVTVYCIGQKPANDYTMQATITEVNVNG